MSAAKCVFERDGFLDARISDIADEAGVSYGSFYHYFTSKDEVFREVARAQEAQLDAQLDVRADEQSDAQPTGVAEPDGAARMRAAADLRDRLSSSIRSYLVEYRAEAKIMGVIEQVSRFDMQVYRLRFERLERFSVSLAESIRRAQRLGAVDPALDPVIVAHVLTATITRFAEALFVQGQFRCPFEEGVVQLTALCCNALRLVPVATTG
ncbi:MAG TPA: TetR/AcrR family transcriptional regulator [Acidimicrobiales bacterium]|nr:TetR/AcrR family transcriptional regulator [Acidimicrobiales bacterium]